MSEQRDGGTTTSLEEVFLSREFGRAPVRRGPTNSTFEDLADAPQLRENVMPEAQPLDDLFLSASFGRPQAVAPRRPYALPPQPAAPHDAVITALPPAREATRYRAIAAVSGVAAAALVVAGVASGGGHAGRPTVSAQGQRVGAQPPQSGGGSGGTSPAPPITNVAAPVVTTAALSGTPGGVSIVNSGSPTAVTASTVSLVVAAPAGTTVAPSPAPTGGSPSSGGSGSPVPTPPTAPSDPLAPVVASVGSTVSGLGNTVTSTVTQVGSAVPPLSPVTALLGGAGTTLSSVGHAMRSPQL